MVTSQFRLITEHIIDALRTAFPDIADNIGKYEYVPGEDDSDYFTVIVVPGDIIPEEETSGDWGNGLPVYTGTVDTFVTYRIQNEKDGDVALYWAEQILTWSHFRAIPDTLRPLRVGGIQRIELIDTDENPSIDRISFRVYFFVTYEVLPVSTALLPGLDTGLFGSVPLTEVQINPPPWDYTITLPDEGA